MELKDKTHNNNNNGAHNGTVILNFRGTKVEFPKTLIQHLPANSAFEKYLQTNYVINISNLATAHIQKEVFINRSPYLFNSILDYFENGELHFPHCLCLNLIQKEIKFWGFRPCQLAECCLDRFLFDKEEDENKHKIDTEWNKLSKEEELTHIMKESQGKRRTSEFTPQENKVTDSSSPIKKAAGCWKDGKKCDKLHHMLNNPTSSVIAKILAGIVIAAILMSVLLLTLESQSFARDPPYEEVIATYNETNDKGIVFHYFRYSYPKKWVSFVDIILTAILTVDFMARLMLSKQKCVFLRQPLSVIDVLGILPVWIYLAIFIYSVETHQPHNFILKYGYYFALLRSLRIFRLGHITLHNKKLRVVYLALKYSWRELLVLFVLISINSFFFGIVEFFVEIWKENTFLTVFDAQWWAIITMTTVGYGDYYPRSVLGRCVGVICALAGMVVVAMATSILINNFLTVYKCVEKLERAKKICSIKRDNESNTHSV